MVSFGRYPSKGLRWLTILEAKYIFRPTTEANILLALRIGSYFIAVFLKKQHSPPTPFFYFTLTYFWIFYVEYQHNTYVFLKMLFRYLSCPKFCSLSNKFLFFANQFLNSADPLFHIRYDKFFFKFLLIARKCSF